MCFTLGAGTWMFDCLFVSFIIVQRILPHTSPLHIHSLQHEAELSTSTSLSALFSTPPTLALIAYVWVEHGYS